MMNDFLYYGDNLEILRKDIKDESVDLVYLDPPFNSNADYNVLFKSHAGMQSEAQIEAFSDTWHWGEEAEEAFYQVIHGGNISVAEIMRAIRTCLGENDMMAYLTMMAVRLLELHRVMKPTASLYLHCDPTASHYLKILLDNVFGATNFRNEIIWKRTGAHNNAKRWGPIHDTIFYYTKSNNYLWNKTFTDYEKGYAAKNYRHEDERGKYSLSILTGAGVRKGSSGLEWKGYNPTAAKRHWAVPNGLLLEFVSSDELKTMNSQEKLDLLNENGLVHIPQNGGVPQYKRYLDDAKGVALQSVITDIPPLSAQAKERLGYPTQKPVALLERILNASSNEGDVVLDPFCGCGTTVHAAQKLKRKWVGIDITNLAISLIEKRLSDAFPETNFKTYGTPKDMEGARALALKDKYQFQWWAVSLVNALPFGGKKKGADGGIDGVIYFGKNHEKAIVSVKGGENVSVAMVRDLAHVVEREKAQIGIFITLCEPTKPMIAEALKAGYYETGANELHVARYPKIQILTIEELFAGAKPQTPAILRMFKQAERENNYNQGDLWV